MTTEQLANKSLSGIRVVLGIAGLLAVIAGILILVWPVKAALVVTWIIAFYAVVGGIVYAAIGIFAKGLGGWARVGHILLGVLYVIAGVVAFANIDGAALFLAIFIAILIGILWIAEGITALTLLSQTSQRGWTIFYSIVSIIAGIFVVFSPFWAASLLWLFAGIGLVVLGIAQIVRAFVFGKQQAI